MWNISTKGFIHLKFNLEKVKWLSVCRHIRWHCGNVGRSSRNHIFRSDVLFEEVMMEEYISIDNDILKLAYSELRILRDLVGEDD